MGVGLALLLVFGVTIFAWVLIKFIKRFLLPESGSYRPGGVNVNRQESKSTDITVISSSSNLWSSDLFSSKKSIEKCSCKSDDYKNLVMNLI